MSRTVRASTWLLLPLLFAVAAGQAAPALMIGSSDPAVTASHHVGTDHFVSAGPGLPAFGAGTAALTAELTPRGSGLRPPVRTAHGSMAPLVRRQTAISACAAALCREPAQYTHLLRATRLNTPATYGNPPPSSSS